MCKWKISTLFLSLILALISFQIYGQMYNTAELIIYDSMVIKASSMPFIDYNSVDHLYAGIDMYSNDVLLFTKDGEVKYQFNRYGEGPKEYYSIHSLYVYFYSQGSVVVLAGNKLKRYTYSGEFIEDIQLLDSGNAGSYRERVFLYSDNNEDTNALYRADQYSKYSIWEKRYYEDTSYHFFINYNLKTEIATPVIGYEDGSVYKNPDVYYLNMFPIGTLNKVNRTFDVLYPNDKYIYVYDVDNKFKLIHKVKLNPDYFKESPGLPFGKRSTNVTKYLQQYSTYYNIFSKADTIVTIYIKGLDDDETFSTFEEANEHPEQFPHYLQIFINGNKVCKDIKRLNMLDGAPYFHSLNRIIFSKAPNEYDEYNNTQTFYFVKVKLE